MKIKTKDLVATALLTSIAIIIPLFVPFKVTIPPFSATLASHVPLILAMYIGPLSAIFVSLGSALGFLASLGPVVAARAAMHVFFVAAGAYMIRKNANIYLTIVVTAILHTLSDMLIVYLLFAFFGQAKILNNNSMAYVQYIIAVGTTLHHLMDYAIAALIYLPLSKQSPKAFPPISFRIKNSK